MMHLKNLKDINQIAKSITMNFKLEFKDTGLITILKLDIINCNLKIATFFSQIPKFISSSKVFTLLEIQI
jgi:hypothetical protein